MTAAALITGASAGLGLEFAKLFAADKIDVVLVARRRDRLDALAAELSRTHGIKAHVITADLMEPAGAQALVSEVASLGVEIGWLVNNAGFGTMGLFHELDAAKEAAEVQLNCVALTALTRAFLPAMISRKKGRILNVGSTAGFQPGPYMATYYATKAFVNSFTEALAYELRGTGVTATVSCPGATATEFAAVAGNDKSKLFGGHVASAPQVAREAYDAMKAGKRMVVHGATNKLLASASSFTPRLMLLPMVADINKAAK
jgi:short-subunit dehydrogenase